MGEAWQIKLIKCRDELASDLSFDLISPQLIQRGIITADQYDLIRDRVDNKSRVFELVDALLSGSEGTYDNFYSYLELEYDWLASQLQNTPIHASQLQNIPASSVFKQVQNTQVLLHDAHNNQGDVQRLPASGVTGPSPPQPSLPGCLNSRHPRPEFNSSSSLTAQVGPSPCLLPRQGSHVHNNSGLPLPPSSSSVPGSPLLGSVGGGGGGVGGQGSQALREQGLDSLSSILSSGSSPRPCESVNNGSPAGSIIHQPSPAGSINNNSSPVHSSDLSIFSGPNSREGGRSLAGSVSSLEQVVGGVKRFSNEDDEISEDMIEFLTTNPIIIRKWQNLAHQVGLSSRVPVIQARIRNDGRDFDEHVSEFIREWSERKPGEATVGGLVALLRKLKFNDTAGKIEDGSFKKKLRAM